MVRNGGRGASSRISRSEAIRGCLAGSRVQTCARHLMGLFSSACWMKRGFLFFSCGHLSRLLGGRHMVSMTNEKYEHGGGFLFERANTYLVSLCQPIRSLSADPGKNIRGSSELVYHLPASRPASVFPGRGIAGRHIVAVPVRSVQSAARLHRKRGFPWHLNISEAKSITHC